MSRHYWSQGGADSGNACGLTQSKARGLTKIALGPCICHSSTPPITSTCQTLSHSEYLLRDSSIHIWFAENGWDARHQYSDKNSLVEWINIVHVECSASAEWVREMEDLTILGVQQNSTCALFPFFLLQVDVRICKFIKICHHAFKKSHLTLKKMHDANAQRVCSTTQAITYSNQIQTLEMGRFIRSAFSASLTILRLDSSCCFWDTGPPSTNVKLCGLKDPTSKILATFKFQSKKMLISWS